MKFSPLNKGFDKRANECKKKIDLISKFKKKIVIILLTEKLFQNQ